MGVRKEVAEVMLEYLKSSQGPKDAIATGLTLLADLVIETSRVADALEENGPMRCEHGKVNPHKQISHGGAMTYHCIGGWAQQMAAENE